VASSEHNRYRGIPWTDLRGDRASRRRERVQVREARSETAGVR